MSKYKVVVYAISKNEAKFVKRWVTSMKEADEIYVLDTGSTDNTVALLKKYKVHVKQKKIIPWRFDVARNISLKMLPKDTDICVCTDLDEVFDKGWRSKLEQVWQKNQTTRVRYNYFWKLNSKNEPVVSFLLDKIHSYNGYTWKHPVHEVLCPSIKENYATSAIILRHFPDITKSRSSYLPLLELSVKENPFDDRNLHYLGREYMYYKEYDKSIETLHQHLACKNATWKDERCASMRFLARCYWAKNYIQEASMWYQLAILEAPYLKEAYVELASLYEKQNEYSKAYQILKKADQIKEKSKSYIIDEFAWNDQYYDLFSLVAFYSNHKKESLEYINKAIEINPDEPRYHKNKQIIQDCLLALHE